MSTIHRTSQILALALTVSLLASLTACRPPDSQREETKAQEQPGTPAGQVTADDVRREMGEVVVAARAYAFERKGDFVAWGRTRLAEIDRRMSELEKDLDARASDLGDSARREWRQTLAELRRQRADLDDELDSTAESTSEVWLEARDAFADAQKKLSDALGNAAETLTPQEESASAPESE